MKDSKAVRLIALAYDEGRSTGFSEGFDCARKEYEEIQASAKSQAYEAGYAKAQEAAYQRGFAEGQARVVSQEEAYNLGYVKGYDDAKSQAFNQGYKQGLGDGETHAASQAYEEGYKRGVEDQGRKTSELMKEAREAGREQVLDEQPKLSVWFMPLGSGPALGYPPGIDKIKAIKAIRWAYGSGEGYGLKEVKDLVEAEPGTLVSCGEPLPQSKAVELYLLLQAAGFEVALRKS